MPGDNRPAQLSYPLDPNSLFALLKGSFILFGTVTLDSGAATVDDRRIKPSSIAVVSYGASTSSPGTLNTTATSGELAIASDSGSDASDVNYIIII